MFDFLFLLKNYLLHVALVSGLVEIGWVTVSI